MTVLLSNKNKTKRPKFLFYLQINELVNIPQSSGFCYVKWNIKDGTGTKKTTIDNSKTGTTSTTEQKVEVSTQNKGLTPRIRVQHHRAQWNYKLIKPIQIKFQIDKNRNLIKKIINFDIFFEFINTDKSNQETVTNRIQLGSVSINLADYTRVDELPITNRFLLKNSKVNSLINITIQLKLTRGNYTDFIQNPILSSNQSSSSTFRSGLPNILENSNNSSSDSKQSTNIQNSSKSSSTTTTTTNKTKGISTISTSMSPMVDSLYAKTFQLPWDPRPNELSPRECVEDIIKGGDGWAKNENGINLIDLQALRLNELENEYYSSNDNSIINTQNNNNNTRDSKDDYWSSNMDRREFMQRRHDLWSNLANIRDSQKNQKNPTNVAFRETRSWSISHVT